jgi:hypothetical protein
MNRHQEPTQNIFAGKMALHILGVGLLMGWSLWAFNTGLFTPTFHTGKQLLLPYSVLVRWAMSWQFVLDENLFKWSFFK